MNRSKTVFAALFAACGLGATPLSYSVVANCDVEFTDGSSSHVCGENFPLTRANASVVSMSDGGIHAFWDAEASPSLDGSVHSATVSLDLAFFGVTVGPERAGTAEVLIDSESVNGGSPHIVSFGGFPNFICLGLGPGICKGEFPVLLGDPFSLEISATLTTGECPTFCRGVGEFADVKLSLFDASGESVPISSAASVPEPGGLAVGGLAALACAVRRKTERRSARRA